LGSSLILIGFLVAVLLFQTASIQNEATGVKASGKPIWEVGSSKVCGDRLCSENETPVFKFYGKGPIKFYGEGPIVLDTGDPTFPDFILRTVIKGDTGVIISATDHGILLNRLSLTQVENCDENPMVLCFEGHVSGLKNVDHPEIGSMIEITIDFENKQQIISMVSGSMNGTTSLIHLEKIIHNYEF